MSKPSCRKFQCIKVFKIKPLFYTIFNSRIVRLINLCSASTRVTHTVKYTGFVG